MKTRFHITVAALLACALALDVSVSSFAQAQPPGRDGAGDRGSEGRGGRGERAGGMRGGFGGGGMMMGGGDPAMGLLRSADVRKELGIEPVQEEALKKIEEQIRAEPRGADRPNPRDFDFRNASEEKRAEFFAKMQADQKQQAEKHRELLEEVLLPGQMERLDELALQRRGLLALADPEIQKAVGLSTAQFEKMQQVRSEQETAIREKMRELFQSGDRSEMREKMAAVRNEMEQAVLGVLTSEQQTKFKEMKGEPFEFGDDAGPGRFGRGGDRGARGGDDRGARGGDRGGRGGEQGGRGGNRGGDRGGRGGDRQ